METYIKIYDWMSEMGLTERIVYALIYQLTERGNGCWMSITAMAQRLRIPSSHCKAATENLERWGAITITKETVGKQTKKVFRATPAFADSLRG